MNELADELSTTRFRRDGFLIEPKLIAPDDCAALSQAVKQALDPLQAPVEYEADVGYPGSPHSRSAPGGLTPRRLLHAYSRDAIFRQMATHDSIAAHLRRLFAEPSVWLSQSHHNCVMTKQPGFSSKTLWHQDIRYWSFDAPELISVWIALGEERLENGALSVIPETHRLDLDRGRLDHALFLRTELEENQALIARAQTVELDPGDVLFFHCRLFHAAGANRTDAVKLSTVFTYHTGQNQPIPGTRSANYPSIAL